MKTALTTTKTLFLIQVSFFLDLSEITCFNECIRKSINNTIAQDGGEKARERMRVRARGALARSGSLCRAQARSGALLRALARAGTPWRALARSGTLWRTLVRSGALWRALARSGALWRALACCGAFLRALARSGAL